MTWKAASDKVIVSADLKATETVSGIVLPSKRNELLSWGIVLAAGPDAGNVQPGDRVAYLTKGAAEIIPLETRVDAAGVEVINNLAVVSMGVDYVMAIQRRES